MESNGKSSNFWGPVCGREFLSSEWVLTKTSSDFLFQDMIPDYHSCVHFYHWVASWRLSQEDLPGPKATSWRNLFSDYNLPWVFCESNGAELIQCSPLALWSPESVQCSPLPPLECAHMQYKFIPLLVYIEDNRSATASPWLSPPVFQFPESGSPVPSYGFSLLNSC